MSGDTNTELELIRGDGNVFRDHGADNADTQQMKAHLAAEVIGVLNRRKLSVRAAGKLVGKNPSDISRIRNADLSRFTIDRLVRIINRLGRHVELKISKIEGGIA